MVCGMAVGIGSIVLLLQTTLPFGSGRGDVSGEEPEGSWASTPQRQKTGPSWEGESQLKLYTC